MKKDMPGPIVMEFLAWLRTDESFAKLAANDLDETICAEFFAQRIEAAKWASKEAAPPSAVEHTVSFKVGEPNVELYEKISQLFERVVELEKLEPMLDDWNIFKRVERLEREVKEPGRRWGRPLVEYEERAERGAQYSLDRIARTRMIAGEFILGPNFPKIVCLCGSTRFSRAFNNANLEETLKGNIVLTVGSMTHSDDELGARITPEIKTMLDDLHFKKIELADEVLVLNQGGYIGESTRNEIAHATRLGKTIRYLEPIA